MNGLICFDYSSCTSSLLRAERTTLLSWTKGPHLGTSGSGQRQDTSVSRSEPKAPTCFARSTSKGSDISREADNKVVLDQRSAHRSLRFCSTSVSKMDYTTLQTTSSQVETLDMNIYNYAREYIKSKLNHFTVRIPCQSFIDGGPWLSDVGGEDEKFWTIVSKSSIKIYTPDTTQFKLLQQAKKDKHILVIDDPTYFKCCDSTYIQEFCACLSELCIIYLHNPRHLPPCIQAYICHMYKFPYDLNV
jgi:hypothetical protein